MEKVIKFSLFKQYKLLYIIPTSNNRIYHVWAEKEFDLYTIGDIIKSKENLKNFCFSLLESTCRVRKAFMPVPFYPRKQADGLYHAYIKFSKIKEI